MSGNLHASLLAISPETKTVEYLDSTPDSGLASDPKSRMKCIELAFVWMAAFLESAGPNEPRFVPSEWRIRANRARQQHPDSLHCGFFTLSHAQFLAFGYDNRFNDQMAWPSVYSKSMVCNPSCS